ncbi:M3 family metallopeptidase [Sphingomonas sp. RP10(2022)]|uniref:oligopeptidase A n=2 Tax=Sphingomonas liriopis TaxID=2949094 RepID=A0A9X2KQI4_9SPHN|nr:M3 family metallopeptidase [Sphingomonas liriopis]MCP3734621.1 M3 family metallopeptidase [Sphingomonas liriopis]
MTAPDVATRLLDPLALPPFPDIVPDAILPALDRAIAEHEAVIATLTAERPGTFVDAWLPYERANTALMALWSAVSHLHAVADTPELRAVHAEAQARLVEHNMQVEQNRDLYEVFVALAASPDFAALSDADRIAVEQAIRDFTLSGVALDAEQRERFKVVSIELSDLSTQFGSAVLDATDAWGETITDEALLAGIAETDKAMFRAAAAANDEAGWRVTLQQPSVAAILTFAEDRDLRARVYRAFATRASDQGPNAGAFDNSARIARILALRHEAAHLLGFADPVAWSLSTKMAPNAGEVLAFLRDLARRAKPAAEADLDAMRTFAAQELGLDDLQPWDVGFVGNRLRQARYAVDEQAVRAYFPVERVMAGWQVLMERLFGIRLIPRDDVALWHPDARYFDVADADGAVFAGLYLDLHARPGKRGGAWMAQARPRLRDGNTIRMPVAYLVCNFAPTGGDAPSLLSHNDVTTLLHETGHCLHHLFTTVDRPSIAGTNGFEWDAIELPSQLMEDFAWDRDVLTGMSGHHETGEPLPADLFERMLAARRFQSGLFIVRQVEFAMFDLLLHLGTMGSDPIEVIEAVRDEVAVIRPPAWHRFPHAFGHIFAGGYASGYYGYLWAELLAADGFRAFAEAGLVDRATGDRFRREVLARGATRPAADSFRAFRGRDADPAAMLARHGLLDTAVNG